LGYLTGADKNTKGKRITVEENAVELRFNREETIVSDINDLNPRLPPKDYRF